jgi:hypothetical protein
MTNLLKTASDKLASLMKSHAGTSVTVRRGASSATATATVGSTPFETRDGEGNVVQQFESRDYLMLAADYQPAGSQVEPQRGDQIDEVVDGTTYTYEVMSPDDGTPVFRYTDRFRTQLRIHTKLVASS